jgi:hypothetical protein
MTPDYAPGRAACRGVDLQPAFTRRAKLAFGFARQGVQEHGYRSHRASQVQQLVRVSLAMGAWNF